MSSITSSDLPQLIRTLRLRLNLSQVKFAKRLGVAFQTVNSWENGHNKPSRMAMKLIREQIDSLGEEGGDLLEKYLHISPNSKL